MSKPEVPLRKIELTYFKNDPLKETFIKDLTPITSSAEETGKKDIKSTKLEKVEINQGENSAPKVEAKKETAENLISEIPENYREERDNTIESISQDEAAQLDYYLRVREKIKRVLNGKNFTGEGDVYVRFAINRDGTLKNLMLYRKSAKNLALLEMIAIKSVRDASPFPPFGDEMNTAEVSFDLPIRFSIRP